MSLSVSPLSTSSRARAVFLDRDGVLVEDAGLPVDASCLRIVSGAPAALRMLHDAGFLLIVVTNQAAVARGVLHEADVVAIEGEVERLLRAGGAPAVDGFYFCPHHPNATVAEFRIACACRKPRAGLIVRAAAEHRIELGASFLIGDRMTDVAAGAAAGCTTVLVRSGAHREPAIETVDALDPSLVPDAIVDDIGEAASWIVAR
jgi:D-glycero-D-manno-heptose 1,7-bisphosphate phosphatase